MRKASIIKAIFLATATAVAVGCSSSSDATAVAPIDLTADSGTPQADHTVKLYSWWTNPGEAEALQALIDAYKKVYPDARVNNGAVNDGENSRKILASTIDSAPPDLFQQNGYRLEAFMNAHPGTVDSVDSLFEEPSLKAAVLPALLKDVSVGGHVVGVPTGVHRENAFFYNKDIFATHKVKPPTSIAELLAVCAALKTAGVAHPLALGGQDWIHGVTFRALFAAAMGAENFRDVLHAKKALTDPTIDAALDATIEAWTTIIAEYVDPATLVDGNVGWSQAATALHDGQAAMMIHGDWVKGYLLQLGWTPDVEFGQTGSPGTSDLFLYGVDVLALPVHAVHREAATEFLRIVASKEGQVAFNRIKGSTPMRTDVRDQLDSLGQKNLDELAHAKVSMQNVPTSWAEAVFKFAKETVKDKAALKKAIVDAPPDPNAPIDPTG